ncbi:UNKNOWN [Stylonychia lemnae]|uniref:Uncharacterized protein n=1 Tax=Stylonychia lemnae TaxID=5949 RepID=A0A078AWX2_STYLE|nr:UNKNOWN [Stylonychia lemnae]|eukprot:CDW85303.1 UNKNOWN [Stylonychia lemnae]
MSKENHIQNNLAKMLYLFNELCEQEFILREEAQLMKRTLFTDEQKIMPALKSYEKSQNLIDFRDRMRGYLGLPRRRSSINKSHASNQSYRKSSHQIESRKDSMGSSYFNIEPFSSVKFALEPIESGCDSSEKVGDQFSNTESQATLQQQKILSQNRQIYIPRKMTESSIKRSSVIKPLSTNEENSETTRDMSVYLNTQINNLCRISKIEIKYSPIITFLRKK